MAKHFKSAQDWEKLAESATSVAQIKAKMDGASMWQIRRQVMEQFGKPTQEWLTAKKLQKAERLLRDGEQIKNVASALEFKYVSNFNRFFAKHTGLSPRQFQRRILKAPDRAQAEEALRIGEGLGA